MTPNDVQAMENLAKSLAALLIRQGCTLDTTPRRHAPHPVVRSPAYPDPVWLKTALIDTLADLVGQEMAKAQRGDDAHA